MTAAARAGERWRRAPFGALGDERLAQRAGAGDERAFAVVYERYHQILYRYCRSILNNDADAQDALQSTFAAAFASLRGNQRDAPMRPWLFRIAHNESISILRRRRPAVELSQASEHATSSIEDQVAERAELSVLVGDLHQLTDRQRSALVLRELSGLSHQEIAIALGTSVGAAKQTIFEARQSLFEFAEGRAMACDEIRRTLSDADGRSLRSRRLRAHLRECGGCAAFADAMPARAGELRALAPSLPGAASVGLLGRIAAAHAGGGGGDGLARLAAGAAAKTASASAGFGANALAGVAVVATATAGVTVGLGRIVHSTARRETARSLHAPARTRVPNPAGAPSPLLASASSPRAGADPVPGAATAGARGTGSARGIFDGLRMSGASGLRVTVTAPLDVGSGADDAPSQSVAGMAYPGASGHEWKGGPARSGAAQAWPGDSSVSGASGNQGSTRGNAAGAASTNHGGSGNGNHGNPGKGNRGNSGKANRGNTANGDQGDSGKPSSATAGQSGRSSAQGSDPSAPTSLGDIDANVPSPVAASAGATVGSATTAVGTVTTTAATALGTVTTTAAGAVTSTVTGAVTSTVAGVLSGKHRHRVSS
jgi:RNA polymerase sigma factor (sigma-70 family)